MQRILLLFSLLITFYSTSQEVQEYFPIRKDDKWGYIDTNGNVLIEPIYESISRFNEGLCAARLNGQFGYLNVNGEVIIPFEYDFADIFMDGYARVVKTGKRHLINKKNKFLFDSSYPKYIGGIKKSGLMIVAGDSYYSHGLINKKGELITDTVWHNIYWVGSNRDIAQLNQRDTLNKRYYDALINAKGKFICKPENKWSIERFYNDVAVAEDTLGNVFAIDIHGKVLFHENRDQWKVNSSRLEFNNERAIVTAFRKGTRAPKLGEQDIRETFIGVINLKGELLFSDPTWRKMLPFEKERAFVKIKGDKWILINTNGNRVCPYLFDDILYQSYGDKYLDQFYDGVDLVKIDGIWQRIDRDGKLLGPLDKDNSSDYDCSNRNGSIVSVRPVRSKKSSYWDLSTDTYYDTYPKSKESEKIRYPLKYVVKPRISGYMNRSEEWIWISYETVKKPSKLNIDYKLSNGNQAYSRVEDRRRIGQTEMNDETIPLNFDIEIDSSSMKFPKDEMGLIVNNDELVEIRGGHLGYQYYLFNTTKNAHKVDMNDGDIHVFLQAKDRNGVWRDLQYSPFSGCGSSYYDITLSANAYWKFEVPVFEGILTTSLRMILRSRDSDLDADVISNEFIGNINPGQLWNENEFYHHGISNR